LLQTQDDERRRIARDLHDSAGQVVTALEMHLASITEGAIRPEVRNIAKESHEMVRQLGKEIRTVSYLLHPPMLNETGLADAIRWYVQGLTERSGLAIDIDVSKDFGRLSDELETALFRIVQESLTNIHRHSGSDTATIRLSHTEKKIRLEIQDRGRGISAQKLESIQNERSGVGITGMRERVRNLNGTMEIQSDSHGTRISVTLPESAANVKTENSFRKAATE
jgi:signal transduction histidine kinase